MKPRFDFISAGMGETSYSVTDETGTYRAELRHTLTDYERSILNYDADGTRKHVESAIGIFRRGAADNCGQIPAGTIAAFNAWQLARWEAAMAVMRADPATYGDNLEWCKEPAPVAAGRWSKAEGWKRVDVATLEHAA